jgi:ABC-type Na+ efflux pump permease subunit
MRSKIAVIALHDLRLTLTDRGAVIWMCVLPIVFVTFFGTVMGGSGSASIASAHLTVVDHDGSDESLALIADLQGEGVEVAHLSPGERQTAEGVVRTLVIPKGFGEGIRAGTQQTLRLEKKPDTSAEAALVVQARIVSAITRLIGRLVRASESTDGVAAEPPAPDLVTVETSVAGVATVTPDGFAQSIPGMAVMFVMLIALTYGAASVSAERTAGNLRRLVTAPVTRSDIIFGKIAGRLLVAVVQITILTIVAVVASRLFGIFIGDHPLHMWFVLVLFAAAVAPLGVALGGWISDPDRAASIGVILTMVMAAFGGCWWPLEIVSKPLQTAALAFPSGWAMKTLHGLISFGQGLGALSLNVVALVGFAAVFGVIASRSLRID